MRRVVITGAGTVNALAHDVAGTWAAMREGRSGIGPLEVAGAERLMVGIGAQVRGWDAGAHLERGVVAQADRFAQFALVAAAQAMAQSGLVVGEGADCGVILGTAGGGLQTQEESYRAVFAEGKNRVHPLTVPRLMANAGASHVSMAHGIRGPVFTVSTACASSNHAMGLAFQMVRSGACRAVLTGGSEAMLTFGGMKAWEGLRVMSPGGCRPFCRSRDGMVQGEGAAVFVFEEREAALARGAEILAEVAGFAMTSDAGDLVAPSVDGAARAIGGALRDAGIAPAAVDYVNAHGTGTAANDRTEAAALRQVFGGQVPPVSATKAMHGHVIGGTGAVELLACLMALRDGVIAPTIGFREADPDCALDVVPNVAREARVEVALSNAFAFGGLNAVLALRRA
ncbi:beta-ketoacyl-[acyl-carrier-protein] synthase family protein [Rhodobacteraceae bacterium HSP-20]|uniref:Nodulation protein E n=1 Tax=Paragemmobacter amnigenus TaxID=2852097 RepID=A0ABS6J7D9_9RHOB|nr:beta-ketoacyl-[acyl-carrier-protein] synthase family protein [Rhodobacter amnigenus]MBU9699427.1 beta-ketoacyl-[acyl-carrier-protein] synthase family protein [Rhodobacter amnigenus]MBV4390654.1 beta-ketoacyl-[acyl-carrier-protein] synthase family protein [Rhodobacter amnigenus]